MPSIWVFLFKKIFINVFLLAVLSLQCCSGAFSSCQSRVYSSLQRTGFSLQWLLLLQSVGSRACWLWQLWLAGLEHRLSSCGAQPWFLSGVWDLLGSRIEPVSLALAGRFLTFGPPGKSSDCVYFQLWYTSTFSRLNTISGCVLYVKRSKDNIIFYDTNTFLILTVLN